MTKAALYARVSTKDKDQTVENQIPKLKQYAENRGWEYEVFEEQESTRKTRPVKYDLLQRVRQGEYQAVVVSKLDRWGRSVKELSEEVVELNEKGITFVSLQDNIDLATSSGKLQFHIISSFAEFERDLIRERTMDGLERARREGKSPGRPKGSKDTKKRRKSGYYMRWINKK